MKGLITPATTACWVNRINCLLVSRPAIKGGSASTVPSTANPHTDRPLSNKAQNKSTPAKRVFLLGNTLVGLMVAGLAVAEDYYWTYGSAGYPHFPSYVAACEYDKNDRNKQAQRTAYSIAPEGSLTGCGISGVNSRDLNGVPQGYLCAYDYINAVGVLSIPKSCQGLVRGGTGCSDPTKPLNPATGSCESPGDSPKNPPNCPSVGKPINLIAGNKHFDFTDTAIVGISPLSFSRHYNSANSYYYQTLFGSSGPGRSPVGLYWHHNYYQGLTVSATEVKLTRNTGQTFSYKLVGSSWQSDADVNFRLTELKDTAGVRIGWKITTPSDAVETYSPVGDLLTLTERNGLAQTFAYRCKTVSTSCPTVTPSTITPFAGQLITVTDNFGRSLNFTYNASGQIATMTDPASNVFSYGYDAAGNLKTVTYPDLTPTVSTDNPKTTYLYGTETGETVNICSPSNTPACTPNAGMDYSHALTGVIDENGVRTMTYQYDASGRAYNEFHNGNIDKYSLNYAPDGSATAVTDPLGTIRTTHFTTVLGVVKPTGTDQPGGAGCSAASSALTYDANGNIASKTDFAGHKTCYAYDLTRNLETARVEGLPSVANCATVLSATSLTAPARKISTSWHASYRLPLKVAEPLKLTTYTYDANGNVLTRSEQASTDTLGTAGLAPTVTGTARTWTYTYNGYGQILTEDGPRTDVADITTNTYYAATDAVVAKRGNLATVKNALNQTTTYNSYDGNGRPTKITSANGVITDLTYFPRGWLKTVTVTGGTNIETTSYSYDNTGQLLTVTQPDTSKLTYGYDAAHRLTSITDNLGNQVIYTLDNLGNRLKEQYKDSGGSLQRNIERVYDTLNRLQTVTGAAQ